MAPPTMSSPPLRPADSDQPIALLFDAGGNPISYSPINFFDGETDTNIFDNDSFLIPVWAGDIGVQPGSTTYPIRYQACTFNAYDFDGSSFDRTDWVSYDVVKPAVATDSPLFADLAGQQIPYTATAPTMARDTGVIINAATAAAPTVDGLLIHLGARTGYRAEIVKLKTG